MTTLKPTTKYVGFRKDEAEAERDRIIKQGGIAWLKDDVSRVHGHTEWMGYDLHYITWKKLSNHVDRIRESKS